MPLKVSQPPASAFSEPSEPSNLSPSQKPSCLITSNQEENPQLIAHNPGHQYADEEHVGRGVKSAKTEAAGRELEDAKSKEVNAYDYEGVLDTVKRKLGAVKCKL